MKYIIIVSLFLSPLLSSGQSTKNKNKAEELGMKAIGLMDEGNYNKSITLLLKAQKLDPDRFDYPYEIAYALYKSGLFDQTVDWLKPIMNHPDVTDVLYQLLGNAYDEKEYRDSAIWSYQKGIEKYPDSGKLYLESGIVEYRRQNYDKAILYWEKGIKAEPNFSSNYFWLARTLSDSKLKIWSLMYGEIFMLLEPNTNRSQEMSEILYNVYNTSIDFDTDTTARISLNKEIIINATDFQKNQKIPFELSYEAIFTLACTPQPSRTKKELDIFTFSKIREAFTRSWNDRKFDTNTLFEFHNDLLKSDVFESYNYWLLMMGDVENYKTWHKDNDTAFEAFAEYFNNNRLKFNKDNLIIRE